MTHAKYPHPDRGPDRYAYFKRNFPPTHPGTMLLRDFMADLGITTHALAQAIGVPATRIHEIIKCRRAITADTSIRLGKYFGQAPGFFLGLQNQFDLDNARDAIGPAIEDLPEHPRVEEARKEFKAMSQKHEKPVRKTGKSRKHLAVA